MRKRNLFLVVFCVISLCLRAQMQVSPTRYDWSGLAGSIVGDATGKREQAYRIYRYLCDNIRYDTSLTIHDADRCYETKSGVCQAYCEMFYRLGAAVGLQVEIIGGKSKNRHGRVGDIGHAWVFAYTDGHAGILIDPTWGAGAVNNGVFVHQENDDSWFDVDPYWMMFSHYPDEAENQLIDRPVDFRTWTGLPYYVPAMQGAGFNGRELLNRCLAGESPDLPALYESELTDVEVNNMPLEGTLRIGRYYDFALKSRIGQGFVIRNEEDYSCDEAWQKIQGYDVIRYMPCQSGMLSLCVRKQDGRLWTVAEYKIAEPTPDDIASLEAREPLRSPVWKEVRNFKAAFYGKHVDVARLLVAVKTQRIRCLPELYDVASFRLDNVPWNGELSVGQTYTFCFSPFEGTDWAIVNESDWMRNWEQDPDTRQWYVTVTPQHAGSLGLYMKVADDSGRYVCCLRYTVK